VLRFGIEMGMSFIDTAELYGGGHAEEIVGHAVKGIRDRVFLASKFNPEHSSYHQVKRAAESSLKRLQTDYLDLYQMHWPNPVVPVEETLHAMRDLVKEGKVRHLGISNCTLDEIKAIRAWERGDNIVSLQMEFNLLERSIENDTLPYCRAEGITVLAYSPLCRGWVFEDTRSRICLDGIAKKYERSIAQVALQWVLSKPGVIAIVKAARPEHTKENAGAVEFTLSSEDILSIGKVFQQEVVDVEPSRIRLDSRLESCMYRSAEEAVENKWDLIPSPMLIAKNIERGHLVKPVPVVHARDKSGAFLYDLVDNQLLYWGWVIARGMTAPIPVSLRNYRRQAEE
jgi:diketogulonate reductase-like aldo/keto reductase